MHIYHQKGASGINGLKAGTGGGVLLNKNRKRRLNIKNGVATQAIVLAIAALSVSGNSWAVTYVGKPSVDNSAVGNSTWNDDVILSGWIADYNGTLTTWTVNGNFTAANGSHYYIDADTALNVSGTTTINGCDFGNVNGRVTSGGNVTFNNSGITIADDLVNGRYTANSYVESRTGSVTVIGGSLNLRQSYNGHDVHMRAATLLDLNRTATNISGATLQGDSVVIRGGSFSANANDRQNYVIAAKGIEIKEQVPMNVAQGAVLNLTSTTGTSLTDSAVLTNLGTLNVVGGMTVSNGGKLSFANTTQESLLTVNSPITLAQGGVLEVVENGKARIKSNNDNLTIDGQGSINIGKGAKVVVEVGTESTVNIKGTMNVAGDFSVLNGTSYAGKAVVDGKVTFAGDYVDNARLLAEKVEFKNGSVINVEQGKGGGVWFSSFGGEADFSAAKINVGKNAQFRVYAGQSAVAQVGNVDVSSGGTLIVDSGIRGDESKVINLQGESAGAAAELIYGYSSSNFKNRLLVEEDKYGKINARPGFNSAMWLPTLDVKGTLTVGRTYCGANCSVMLGKGTISGTLDLLGVDNFAGIADDGVYTLAGETAGKGQVLVKTYNGLGAQAFVPYLRLSVDNGRYGELGISATKGANYSMADIDVGDGAVMTLVDRRNGAASATAAYWEIGGFQSVNVAHSGELHLSGQNVEFSLGDKYNEAQGANGSLVLDQATGDRVITTDKDSFDILAQRGGVHIGNDADGTLKNVLEVTLADGEVLDVTALQQDDGWINTVHTTQSAERGTGAVSGDGWLKTATAVLGSVYNDTRLGLLVENLKSAAESISIDGLVTAVKTVAMDSLKTLNLTANGLFTLGADTEASTFDLSGADVNFKGGRMVVESNASVADDSTELNPATLTVKSLNFTADAGAGSLTIKDGAQVLVANDGDYTKRNFTTTFAPGTQNPTQLVTLNGSGAKLIVSAKDLLSGDGSGRYSAADAAGVIGGYGILKINQFVDFARNDQNLQASAKPKLNLTDFIAMRHALRDAGTTTNQRYDVLIEFDKDDVEAFFDPDGNINRADPDTKEWLDNGTSASGDLVYNVEKNNPSTTDERQQWGAAKNTDNNDTLIIGKDADTGEGTSKDVTLDNAGAGTGDKATDKKYFVRYDDTTDPDNPKKDELGNIKFVEDEAKGTLTGGGVIGSVTEKDGIRDADLIFKDGKAAPDFDPDNKKGFASGSINLPGSNVTGDHADVIIGLVDKSPANPDRDAGNLKSKDLIVKNDSSFTINGTSDIENLKFGNDADAGYAGSTNKVDFKGKADIDNIIADGSKVTKDQNGNYIGGAAGKAEAKFNDTDDNTVGTITVAGDNNLAITGKVEVTGEAKVSGSLSTDSDVKLKGGLTIVGTDVPAEAFVKSGSLESTAQVGGDAGDGFLYLGSTQDRMESPNTIGKNWRDSEAALKTRVPGSSYNGIGYLDENGYDISNATINIGNVTGGSQGTLTVGAGGALIVTDQALTAPADGQWNYTAGLKGDIANQGGTVMIGDLNKIGNRTSIKLATGTVTESDGAQWVTKNPLYTLTLRDNVLYASFNSTATDIITGKTDKDLADLIKDQGKKDQSEGGGFDKDRNDGHGFISKVLDDTVTNENGVDFDATADRIGKTLSSATRFAVLGGAAQNSQLASDMVTAQVEERAGFRTSTASRMAAGNGEAGSLWVSPLYNKNRSGHLQAGSFSYGVDADLYGMSFGGDVAVNDAFRIGAAFSGGKGSSDAVGMMPTKNDFDFYSGSLYAITDIGSVTLLTDLDYTWLKGDVNQTNRITTLKSTVKSNVTSFGVSAKRTFEVNNGTLVAPYAGLRVNRLHINGYDVKDTDGNAIITAESQQQYYATVPVGVQVSKNFELTNGFVKPVLDLGLVTTLGSRHMESRVTYTGFGETSATSEVRDRLAFTVKFGLNAEVGNLGLGLGYGLTGSSSLTSNQVYGNVRYRF